MMDAELNSLLERLESSGYPVRPVGLMEGEALVVEDLSLIGHISHGGRCVFCGMPLGEMMRDPIPPCVRKDLESPEDSP